MNRSIQLVFLLPLLMTVSGCATIVSGTTQKVSVSSQPSGADVKAEAIPALNRLKR